MHSIVTKDYVCFLQAEDGIRDYKVTGVQTCVFRSYGAAHTAASASANNTPRPRLGQAMRLRLAAATMSRMIALVYSSVQIGRASCRERMQISVVARELRAKKEENS